jgi:hypothetical protein
MPQSVIDLGSNLPENLERWGNVLKGGGSKLSVFKIIYSGKRSRWTAKEISNALNGSLSAKRVTEAGKKLVGDGLIRQAAGVYPIVYEKIPEVHHLKTKIMALVKNAAKLKAIATKRKVEVNLKVTHAAAKSGKAVSITIDEIDQFSKIKKDDTAPKLWKPLSENRFKTGLLKLFKDTGEFKDWGGEKNDFLTNKLRINGKRHVAAFALKGPGVGVKTMSPGKWGKQGDQIQRLIGSPATVYFLQFEGKIDDNSIEQLKKLAAHKAYEEKSKLFYGYIDRDDSLRLRRAYPKYF